MWSSMTLSLRRTTSPALLSSRWPRATTSRALASTATDNDNKIHKEQQALVPWKTAVVECHGDYRDEAWLEQDIGGPLYEHQAKLPRLPVPSLQATLERFVPTALPLARTDEEIISLQTAVEKFPRQAAGLQERLKERRDELANSSWLQQWWNQTGYLQVRDPVVINVSYFFHFSDDAHAGTDPIQRAAALLSATADYRQALCSGQLPTETVGKHQTPLCSTAYKYMFHATRIPALTQDSYNIYDPNRHAHVLVACRGHFFAMDCWDDTGKAYPVPVLQEGLQTCRDLAAKMPTRQAYQWGWLTSQNRNDWATCRETLLQMHASVGPALELLQSGALLVCLDDDVTVSRTECAQQFLHAGRQASAGMNRWFDKSIQLIVSANAKVGLLGEHSMMDGMPVVGFANQLTQQTYDKVVEKQNVANVVSCHVRPIFGDVFEQLSENDLAQLDQLVSKAKNHLVDLVDQHSLHVQSFQGYGSDFIKKAGYSPDAYVQMAMQLATYRLWGEQAGTYEASQVRPFLHGRTETTRSVSTESAAFVHKMGLRPQMNEHDASIRQQKLSLLQKAVDAHVKYIRLAAKAEGVDRHFFGLSMLVQDGEKAPDLYSHPVFVRSKRWRVSTSHLTHPRFDTWGYGEVVPDGVGLAYSIHKRHCVFNIVALKEHGWTDKLAELLEEALLEMRTLIEMDTPPTSKL